MIASLLLLSAPSSGFTQGLPVDFDAETPGAVSFAQAGLSQMPDHPPSTTETSAARAKVVRHGERTIRLIGNSAAAASSGIVVASANPVGS